MVCRASWILTSRKRGFQFCPLHKPQRSVTLTAQCSTQDGRLQFDSSTARQLTLTLMLASDMLASHDSAARYDCSSLAFVVDGTSTWPVVSPCVQSSLSMSGVGWLDGGGALHVGHLSAVNNSA